MTVAQEQLETLDLPRHGARALVGRPAGRARSAAIVNHGNPGVPAYLRKLMRRLAEAHVTAAVLAGDGRVEPRPLATVTPAEREEWRTEAFADRYLAMTRELVGLLQSEHGRVAVVGFCGGGWHAVRLAAEGLPVSRVAGLHAALRFRTDDPREDLLSYLPNVRAPLQFHFGAADSLTPAADIDALRAESSRLGLETQIHVYPGAGHGFLDPDDDADTFDPATAERATERLVEFLAADGLSDGR